LASQLPNGSDKHNPMTNTLALWLGAIIIAVFIADAVWFEWGLPVFVMKQLSFLIEWLAVWR